jgi:hypothetical protein
MWGYEIFGHQKRGAHVISFLEKKSFPPPAPHALLGDQKPSITIWWWGCVKWRPKFFNHHSTHPQCLIVTKNGGLSHVFGKPLSKKVQKYMTRFPSMQLKSFGCHIEVHPQCNDQKLLIFARLTTRNFRSLQAWQLKNFGHWRINDWNLFLVTTHNKGSPNVNKCFLVSVLIDTSKWMSTWHLTQNGHIMSILTTLLDNDWIYAHWGCEEGKGSDSYIKSTCNMKSPPSIMWIG